MIVAHFACMLVILSRLAAAQLTDTEKNNILKKHNDLRAAISIPCTAADMETLAWDASLASGAASHAANCVGEHASGAGSSFGENIWMSFGSDISAAQYTSQDMVGAVQDWYNEGEDVDWVTDPNGNFIEVKPKAPGPKGCVQPESGGCVIAHFTAVIWASTNILGCGIKACTHGLTISGTSYAYGTLLVCRYNPPGNYPAAPHQSIRLAMPFLPGSKCAACSRSCSTPGLCDVGATPIRCKDTCAPCMFNNVNYPTCTEMIQEMSSMFGRSGLAACHISSVASLVSPSCDYTCSKCSVPSNVGNAYCGGATGAADSSSGTTGSPSRSSAGSTSPGELGSYSGASLSPSGTSGSSSALTNSSTRGIGISSGTSGSSSLTTGSSPGATTGTSSKTEEAVGTLIVTTNDPSAFASHTNTSLALQQAIAAHLVGITYDLVEIASISVVRRLQENIWTLSAPGGVARRRMTGAVNVNYKIIVPAGVTLPTTSIMQAAQNSMISSLNSKMLSNGITSVTAIGIVAQSVSISEPQGFIDSCFHPVVFLPKLAFLGILFLM